MLRNWPRLHVKISFSNSNSRVLAGSFVTCFELLSTSPPTKSSKTSSQKKTYRVIANQLVSYHSVDQLQKLNQPILRTVCETSPNTEDQEKVIRTVVEKENEEALREAYAIIQGLNGDLETQKKRSYGIVQA